MKTLIIVSLFAASFALAQTKNSSPPPAVDTSHIEMHEKMAKAHQEAANCLKAGKTKDECQTSFQTMCKRNGDPEYCGMKGTMKGHNGHSGMHN